MENALDEIAKGKQEWQQYLSGWNEDYFTPALANAKTLITPSNGGKKTVGEATHRVQKSEVTKVPCPQCTNPLVKVPSSKLAKKFFLKCVSGCENVVLFWSDFKKSWEVPKPKVVVAENSPSSVSTPQKLTAHSCPVCKKPLLEHGYTKDGQDKVMLKCSGAESSKDKKHNDVAYFRTAQGWWSPKFGELG